MNIKYNCTLLAVADVERSKKFYHDVFNQEVVLDLGKNVTFSGGFAVQEGFAQLLGFNESESVFKPKNMELYFETDDFDEFIKRLHKYDVAYVHKEKQYEWKQRVIRIYDPDGHIIEIGESMAVIARRYLNKGCTPEETAKIIQHPLPFVLAVQCGNIQ